MPSLNTLNLKFVSTAFGQKISGLAVGLMMAAGLTVARADSLTWDPSLTGGSGGNGTWDLNSTANWWNGSTDVTWKDNSAGGTNVAVFGGTAGTVTLNTSLSASSLQFTTGGYTLSGSGTLTLGGNLDASALASGTTTVGNALSLAGGQQWLVGSGGTLAVNGTVTRNLGATVNFTNSISSTSLANVNGILGGWATVNAGDWATNNGTAIVAYTGYTAVSGNQPGTGASAQNWKNTASATLTGSATINSLAVNGGDFGVNSGMLMTLGSGGMILQSGSARWILNNGSGSTAGTGQVTSGSANGEFFVDVLAPITSVTRWEFWPTVVDNGATSVSLIKYGPGAVGFANNNTFSGKVMVNSGYLGLGGANLYTGGTVIGPGAYFMPGCARFDSSATTSLAGTAGTGAVTNNGGAMQMNYRQAGTSSGFTNKVVLNNGAIWGYDGLAHVASAIQVGSGGGYFGGAYHDNASSTKGLYIDGVLSGSGSLVIEQAVAGGNGATAAFNAYGNGTGNTYNCSVVVVSNNANTYSGTVTVYPYTAGNSGSYLELAGTNALASAAINLTNANTAGCIYGSGSLLFQTGLGGTFAIGGLTGNGNLVLNGFTPAATYYIAADPITLTVGGNNGSTTHAGIISGGGGLTKIGSGTLTLSGANIYTGNTTVSAGTLALTGGGAIASSNIVVAGSATFDVSALGSITLGANQNLLGSGTNNGSVYTGSSSKVYAGLDGTYGTNTFNNDLNLASGTAVCLDVGTLANGSNDLITVTGTLYANNNQIHLKAPSGSSLQTTDYTIFTSPNTISGSFASAPVWDVAPANSGNFSIVTGANTVTLHYSANSGPVGTATVSASTVVRNQTILITVNATNGLPGTVNSVTVDASPIGGSSSLALVQASSSGNHSVWTNSVTVMPDTLAGGKTLVVTMNDTASLSGVINIPLTVVVANDVWNGAAGDDNFTSNLNWTNQTAPGYVGDSLTFAGTTRLTPSMDYGYDVTGVTFATNAGSFNIGTANFSTLTLSGGVTNNSANVQTLDVPILLNTAQTVNAASNNIAIGGVLSGGGSLTKVGNGTLSMSGSGNSLSGTLTVYGGTMNVTAGSTAFGTSLSYVGYRDGSGNLNVSGGTFYTGGELRVGGSEVNGAQYNAVGNLSVSNGASVSIGGALVAARGNNNQNTVSGTITVDNGTLNTEGDILLGFAGNQNLGKFVVNAGGTANVASSTKRWLIMSQYDTSKSEVDINGGHLNLNAGTDIHFAISGNSGTNTFNLNSGAVTFYSDNATTIGGSGVIDMLYGLGACVNTFNLNGGILTVSAVTSSQATGSRAFNFNGGTLKSPANNAAFFSLGASNGVANVRNGGAVIDDGGYAIEIGQPLVHSTIAGDNAADGGLTKLGAGSLTLGGTNTYTGATLINAGTLALTGSGSIGGSTNIVVGSGAIFDVSGITYTLNNGLRLSGFGNVNGNVTAASGSGIYGGTDGVYGTNTFNSNLTLAGGAAVYFDIGTSATGTNDQLIVSGTLTASGNIMHLKAPSASASLDPADYVLITSANAISGSFASSPVWDVAPVNATHYSIVTSGNTVTLHYSTFSAPTAGGVATPNPAVRNQTVLFTVNATNGSPGTVNNVVVDASQVGGSASLNLVSAGGNVWTNSVVITPDTAPGSKTFAATVTDSQSLSALASIPLTVVAGNDVWNGAAAVDNFSSNLNWTNHTAPGYVGDSLAFAGTTRLTPSLDFSYMVTGLTFDSTAGSFNIGTANSSVLTNSGSIVNNSANPQTVSVPVMLTGTPTINSAVGSITLVRDVSGTVGLTKTGSGSATLSAANTYTGQTTVNAGALTISGSVGNTSDNIIVGNVAGNAALNISGNVTNKTMIIGNLSNSVAAVYQTAGVLDASTASGVDQMCLANVQGSYGYFGAFGGIAKIAGLAVGGENNNGSGSASFGGNAGNAIFEVGGGDVNCTGWLVLSRNANAQACELNVYRGSLSYAGGGIVNCWGGGGQSAVVNILGGVVTNSNDSGFNLNQNGNASNASALNLNGGVAQANGILNNASRLNFNGGTLRASRGNSGFINGTGGSTCVYAGGATIDNNGYAITVVEALQAPAGNGVQSVTSFTGGAGYIAPPIITITNATGDTTGVGATAIAQINPATGVVTNIVVTCPGVNYTAAPVFVFSGGGATTQASVTSINLAANTSGGLTATGSGTTTLSGANTYTGNTVINAGTLEFTSATIATNSTVSVASGAVLKLSFSATTTNRVSALVLNGVTQSPGVYNAANTPTYISGTGNLIVPATGPSGPASLTNSVSGSTLSLSWPAGQGWRLQMQTNGLSTGLGTNWVYITDGSISNTNITVDPTKPTVFYRLRYP